MENRKFYYYKNNKEGKWELYEVEQKNGKTRNYNFDFETEEEAKQKVEEYNTTYHLYDYSNEEITKFFNEVDFEPLKKAVNEYIGQDLTYTITLDKEDRFGYVKYFSLETKENLALDNHLINIAWKSLKVVGWSCGFSCDKKTGELQIWGSIHYRYESLNGGSNGTELMSFSYSKSKGWITMSEKERKEKMEEYYGK